MYVYAYVGVCVCQKNLNYQIRSFFRYFVVMCVYLLYTSNVWCFARCTRTHKLSKCIHLKFCSPSLPSFLTRSLTLTKWSSSSLPSHSIGGIWMCVCVCVCLWASNSFSLLPKSKNILACTNMISQQCENNATDSTYEPFFPAPFHCLNFFFFLSLSLPLLNFILFGSLWCIMYQNKKTAN